MADVHKIKQDTFCCQWFMSNQPQPPFRAFSARRDFKFSIAENSGEKVRTSAIARTEFFV